jgi:hypothetical protein
MGFNSGFKGLTQVFPKLKESELQATLQWENCTTAVSITRLFFHSSVWLNAWSAQRMAL